MLHQNAVLEHADLGDSFAIAHDHHAVNGLAAGEELGFRNVYPTAVVLTSVAAAVLATLHPSAAS